MNKKKETRRLRSDKGRGGGQEVDAMIQYDTV